MRILPDEKLIDLHLLAEEALKNDDALSSIACSNLVLIGLKLREKRDYYEKL